MEKKESFFGNLFKGLAKTYGRKVAFGLLAVLVGWAAFIDALHVANIDAAKALELFFEFIKWVCGIVIVGNGIEHASAAASGKKVTPPVETTGA